MSGEIWKPVVGFPDYEVSSGGRVRRSLPDRHGRGAGKAISPVARRDGYRVVSLHLEAKQHVRLVHRIVTEAFHGPAPSDGHQAAHSNGDRADNRAVNLRWATPSENNLDKLRHGTMRVGARHHARANPGCMPRGVGHGNAKLSDAAVRSIRIDSRSQKVIAAAHGVSQSLISQIKSGKGWSHVTEEVVNDRC